MKRLDQMAMGKIKSMVSKPMEKILKEHVAKGFQKEYAERKDMQVSDELKNHMFWGLGIDSAFTLFQDEKLIGHLKKRVEGSDFRYNLEAEYNQHVVIDLGAIEPPKVRYQKFFEAGFTQALKKIITYYPKSGGRK